MKIGNEMNNIQGFGAMKQKKYDPKEAEVARKLGMSYEEFSKLSEEEKAEKVRAYNKAHPDNPIQDKGAEFMGVQMQNFKNDVNWKNVKLQ